MPRKYGDFIISFLATWAKINKSKWKTSKISVLEEKIVFKTIVIIFSILSVRLTKN